MDAACERDPSMIEFVIESRPFNVASRRVARSLGMRLQSRTACGRDGLLTYGIDRLTWELQHSHSMRFARVS
jgi:RimJ/RimL family protein N-acetyltransferase